MNSQKTGSGGSLPKNIVMWVSDFVKTAVRSVAVSFSTPARVDNRVFPRKKLVDGNVGRMIESVVQVVVCAALGFVLSLGKVGDSVYPFGTAFLVSGAACVTGTFSTAGNYKMMEKINCSAIFAGACAACFTYESFVLSYIGLNLVAFVVKMWFLSSGAHDGVRAKLLTASACCALMAVPRMVLEPSAYSVLSTILHFVLSLLTVWVLSKSMEKGVVEDSVAIKYLKIAVLVYCLRGISYFGTSVCYVAASVGVMCFAKLHGSVFGCVSGVIFGAACFGEPFLPTVLALCGLCDGVFSAKVGRFEIGENVFFVPTVHTFCSVICAMFFCTEGFEQRIITDSIVAVFVYMSFMHRLEAEDATVFATHDALTTDVYGNDLEGLSDAFAWLSKVFFQMSDKLKNPPPYEVKIAVEKACRGYCSRCTRSEECKVKAAVYGSEFVIKKLASASGKLTVAELPHGVSERCTNAEKLVSEINLAYKNVFSDYFKNNKTEILAAQYSSMARLIRHTSKSCAERSTQCMPVAVTALDALDKMGIRPEKVTATSGRGTVIDAIGVRIETVSKSASELSAQVSKATGILMSTPEFIMDGAAARMRFRQKRKICVEYAKACHAKSGQGVSGDSVSFFESDKDYFYALISDGMGSGREAALTSRLTAVFIEKLLSTGAHKGATLELLNNLLLSKNNECFATVDLLEIDLLEARASFIKAGAAPAFVVRSAKLYKISSETPPAGIINAFSAENTSFSLCSGDVILLLSDGIIEGFDSTPWLAEILGFHRGGDIAELASKILARAKELALHDDDMSVVAVRVR